MPWPASRDPLCSPVDLAENSRSQRRRCRAATAGHGGWGCLPLTAPAPHGVYLPSSAQLHPARSCLPGLSSHRHTHEVHVAWVSAPRRAALPVPVPVLHTGGGHQLPGYHSPAVAHRILASCGLLQRTPPRPSPARALPHLPGPGLPGLWGTFSVTPAWHSHDHGCEEGRNWPRQTGSLQLLCTSVPAQ